jgi:hypothetical protein
MARCREQRWEKNKQHKRENVDTNREDTCLMKSNEVLKKAVKMKDYEKINK